MHPRFATIKAKKLIGMRVRMSLLENKTYQLFSSFMPRRNEIIAARNGDILDLKVYPNHYFQNFSPAREFEKWALIEVENFDHIPPQMHSFGLPAGDYAVFLHKGPSSDSSTFEYIFRNWLPESGHQLDNRPHFEVLGEKTKRNHPHSEEEIWIPIR